MSLQRMKDKLILDKITMMSVYSDVDYSRVVVLHCEQIQNVLWDVQLIDIMLHHQLLA